MRKSVLSYTQKSRKRLKHQKGNTMYQIIRGYNDFTSMTERTDSITRALSAAAIYLEDPDCFTVKIFDEKNEKIVLDYYRD